MKLGLLVGASGHEAIIGQYIWQSGFVGGFGGLRESVRMIDEMLRGNPKPTRFRAGFRRDQ